MTSGAIQLVNRTPNVGEDRESVVVRVTASVCGCVFHLGLELVDEKKRLNIQEIQLGQWEYSAENSSAKYQQGLLKAS